jgi:hypothetical protein
MPVQFSDRGNGKAVRPPFRFEIWPINICFKQHRHPTHWYKDSPQPKVDQRTDGCRELFSLDEMMAASKTEFFSNIKRLHGSCF